MSQIKEHLKRIYGDKCVICGISGKKVPLHGAHYRARSRGGKLIFLLCPNCHGKFDRGLLTSAELKKIGLTKERYERYIPLKKRKSSKPDKKYYYLWGDGKRRYKSEATLPKPAACRPGKHNWEASFVFGTEFCTKCKTKRVAI